MVINIFTTQSDSFTFNEGGGGGGLKVDVIVLLNVVRVVAESVCLSRDSHFWAVVCVGSFYDSFLESVEPLCIVCRSIAQINNN